MVIITVTLHLLVVFICIAYIPILFYTRNAYVCLLTVIDSACCCTVVTFVGQLVGLPYTCLGVSEYLLFRYACVNTVCV